MFTCELTCLTWIRKYTNVCTQICLGIIPLHTYFIFYFILWLVNLPTYYCMTINNLLNKRVIDHNGWASYIRKDQVLHKNKRHFEYQS